MNTHDSTESRLARLAQIALIDLDLAAETAVQVMKEHPQYVPVIHRLIGRLGNMHAVLTEVVKLMTEENEESTWVNPTSTQTRTSAPIESSTTH